MDLRFAGAPVAAARRRSTRAASSCTCSRSRSRCSRARASGAVVGARPAASRRCSRSSTRAISAARCRSRPRSPSSSRAASYDRHLARLRRVLRGAARRAARGARARHAGGRALDRRPRAATRSGSSCPARSTRATCSPTRSRAGVLFAPGSQFHSRRPAVERRCASRSRWPTRTRCAAASQRLARVVRERTARAARRRAGARDPRLRPLERSEEETRR